MPFMPKRTRFDFDYVIILQSYAESHWNKHGKPAFDSFLQKVSFVYLISGRDINRYYYYTHW